MERHLGKGLGLEVSRKSGRMDDQSNFRQPAGRKSGGFGAFEVHQQAQFHYSACQLQIFGLHVGELPEEQKFSGALHPAREDNLLSSSDRHTC